jgi:hypothetical protein
MIDAVASVRALKAGQLGFLLTNAVGKVERTNILFPLLVISEWSEENSEGESQS